MTMSFYRREGAKRLLVGTPWLILATVFMAVVWFPVAILMGGVDIFAQIVLDREVLGPSNNLTQIWGWYTELLEWFLTGREEFNALPIA